MFEACDRCGARAKVRVFLTEGELLLCGHHAAQHGAALVAIGAKVEPIEETEPVPT